MGIGVNGHKQLSELEQELAEAAKKIKVDATYAHYKNQDHTYVVRQFAFLESTDELCVVFEALYAPGGVCFVRPVSEWLEEVEWQGKTVPRFAMLEA